MREWQVRVTQNQTRNRRAVDKGIQRNLLIAVPLFDPTVNKSGNINQGPVGQRLGVGVGMKLEGGSEFEISQNCM